MSSLSKNVQKSYKKKLTNLTTYISKRSGWKNFIGSKNNDLYLWLIYLVVWQKLTEHCKEIVLQLRKKKS